LQELLAQKLLHGDSNGLSLYGGANQFFVNFNTPELHIQSQISNETFIMIQVKQ
jgi:hypothetical protein